MATWAKAAKACVLAGSRALSRQTVSGLVTTDAQAVGKLPQLNGVRTFASGGAEGEKVTYAGVTLHKPAKWHVYTGEALGALMWFWVFYRFYHDYDTFLFGHAHHFEHELEHEKEHAEGQEH